MRIRSDELLSLLFLFFLMTQIDYLFPREFISSEVTTMGSLLVDGSQEVELLDDSVRSEIEVADDNVP